MSATTGCIRTAGPGRDTTTYLREHGYEAPNPWEHWANSGADDDGRLQNGWLLVHADKAARVPEEHSETPYMTRRAMDFIAEAEADGRPWCLHLSYIKPHWPYIAPEPYASMYGAGRHAAGGPLRQEKQDAHPVFARLHGHALLPQHVARRGARKGHPDLYGPDQADRRPDGRADALSRSARPARHHHDRVHLGPWRLSRRSLDGREGSVPRAVGEDPADRDRSLAGGRRHARHGHATRWSRRSIWRRPSSTISAASRRIIFSRAVADAAAARRSRPRTGARSCSPNTTTACRTCG